MLPYWDLGGGLVGEIPQSSERQSSPQATPTRWIFFTHQSLQQLLPCSPSSDSEAQTRGTGKMQLLSKWNRPEYEREEKSGTVRPYEKSRTSETTDSAPSHLPDVSPSTTRRSVRAASRSSILDPSREKVPKSRRTITCRTPVVLHTRPRVPQPPKSA